MNGDVAAGFLQATAGLSLLATGAGSLIGLVVGMIPGMTISSGIIIVLPLTFVLDPEISIALLLGLYVGGMMGGSFAAILLNIPGTPSASATAADGYPMARRGEAGRALGIAITASFIGGLVSFAGLYFIAPLLADVALQFRTPDMFALVFFGLTIICSFAGASLIKALLSAALGLMIVTIGQDPVMGTARFTFGSPEMLSGVHFLTAMIGLFAIPQIIENLGGAARAAAPQRLAAGLASTFPRLSDLKLMRVPVALGSGIGASLGILPGVGGPIAAFIAYGYARRLDRGAVAFGEGAPGGIAAPESANNAVTGGALIPMMTLGIPGDPVTAILIGALMIHGLAPGPLLFVENGGFAYGIIFSFFWANIFNIVIAFAGLRLLIKLLSTPKPYLMPTIAVLCVVGSFALQNSLFDVAVMFGFGLIGLAMRWADMPVVPLLLALVLGRQVEENLRISLTGSQGDISVFLTSPISATFLILSVLSVALALRPREGWIAAISRKPRAKSKQSEN